MSQTSFPPSSIFGTGPFLVGKSDSGFGLGAELGAATLRSAFSLQETLTSGTNIKTVNGTSLLGSGNISVSASPAGESTQLQFNSSGSFAGTSRLTWASGTGLSLESPVTGIIQQILPPTGASYVENVPFNITSGVSINSDVGTIASGISSYNFGVNLELNGNAGGTGELYDDTKAAIGIRFESNYITNRRGFNEVLQEMHFTHTPCITTTNTTAGTHIRWMSVEILTGQNANTGLAQAATGQSITSYFTMTSWEIRSLNPSHTGPYLAAIAGELKVGDGIGNLLTIGVDADYAQYTADTHLFSGPLQAQSTLTSLGKLQVQDLGAADAAVIYGGITAGGEIYSNAQGLKSTKSVTANNSFALYSYATYGTPTTQPAALTGAIQLIVVENGGNLELRALGPTGATDLISTLAAS